MARHMAQQLVFSLEECLTNVTFVGKDVQVVENVLSGLVVLFTAPLLVAKKKMRQGLKADIRSLKDNNPILKIAVRDVRGHSFDL